MPKLQVFSTRDLNLTDTQIDELLYDKILLVIAHRLHTIKKRGSDIYAK